MTGRRLLASSASAEGLAALVRRYVCAGRAALVVLDDGGGVQVDGRTLRGVRWRVQRGRWRFEEVDDAC